jgi:hypothetical protein
MTLPTSIRRTGLASVLTLIGSLALAGVATPALAAETDTQWSVAPANAVGPDGRVSLRHTVDPGASVDDAIVVTNLGGEAATFVVSAGDGIVGDAGAFDISREEPTDSGAWIGVGGLSDGGIALAPGEARVLPVAISVPQDATPGDHPAGIVVGVSNTDGASTVTTRIGVRLHLRVAGEAVSQLGVTDVAATFTPSWIPFVPGRLGVTYTLENTGDVRLGAAARVRAEGAFGIAGTTEVQQAGELLPGDTVTSELTIPAAPLMLLFGDIEVSPLAVGEDDVAIPDAASEEFTALAVSWTSVAVVLIVIGGVVLAVVLRRRSTRGRSSSQTGP